MKELTYEDWQKNPTPRMMWVWDNDVEKKEKQKVVYVLNNSCTYRVLSIVGADFSFDTFKHCAEIEKTRRMTHKELSRWLREKPTRELKCVISIDCSVFSWHSYTEREASKEVPDSFLIRENDSDWREPLVEVEECL